MSQWRNRIVRYGEVDPADLLANPNNFRRHPVHQQKALSGLIGEIGYLDPVLIQDGTDMVIDGHLRVELAMREGITSIPVQYVDLSDSEAALALASFDPVSALATADADKLRELLDDVSTGDAAVMQMLSDLAEREGVISLASDPLEPTLDDFTAAPIEPAANATLAARFLVPPFSVLDARQGYWQERKRAWLSLGIRSELGRGENLSSECEQYREGDGPYAKGNAIPGRSMPPTSQGSDGKLTRRDLHMKAGGPYAKGGTIGAIPPNERDNMSRSGSYSKQKSSPGGSPRPAMRLGENGKTVRGDGHGRGLARTFGQDLMKGEHVVGSGGGKGGRAINDHAWQRDHLDAVQAPEEANGTSVFDPVLTELAYRWFSPPTGAVLDPFAGGSVRGIVAAMLGRSYTGIDLSAPQIAANIDQATALIPNNPPAWIVGDSLNVADMVPAGSMFDFLFSCPPYADLEVYSDDARDLSTMAYDDFLAVYRQIIERSVALLNPDRFACFVVGDVRSPKGHYRNFVSDTISAFQDAGALLYNEAILVTALGSLPIRVARQFEAGRKLGKTHQNVLVFIKGDAKKATQAIGPVDLSDELFKEAAA